MARRWAQGVNPAGAEVPKAIPPDLYAQQGGYGGNGSPAGELAPDFVLTDLENRPFELSQEVSNMPVVLEFGSFT